MTAFPQRELEALAAAFDGRFGFYAEDLASGAAAAVNAGQRFPTASVCKVPVMVELFRQAAAGELSLSERRRLGGPISTHGSGALSLVQDEPELTLLDYGRLMIAVSDNVATDMLMGVVGLENVNATMEGLGFPDLRTRSTMGRYHYAMVNMADRTPSLEADEEMMRRMRTEGLDHGAWPYHDAPENNVASPAHMGGLLKALHQGQVVDAGASAQMVELLKSAANRTMLPRHLDPGVAVAHKYGSSGRIKGDAGLLFLPSGPMVAAGFATAAGDDADGAGTIAEACRLVVESLSPESLKERDE